jgi:hypothetical protein
MNLGMQCVGATCSKHWVKGDTRYLNFSRVPDVQHFNAVSWSPKHKAIDFLVLISAPLSRLWWCIIRCSLGTSEVDVSRKVMSAYAIAGGHCFPSCMYMTGHDLAVQVKGWATAHTATCWGGCLACLVCEAGDICPFVWHLDEALACLVWARGCHHRGRVAGECGTGVRNLVPRIRMSGFPTLLPLYDYIGYTGISFPVTFLMDSEHTNCVTDHHYSS